MKFRFSLLSEKEIEIKIKAIAEQENITISDKGLKTIVELSNGDMRKGINILQSIPLFCKGMIVNDFNIRMCLGYPTNDMVNTTFSILISNDKVLDKYTKINNLIKSRGVLLRDLIQCLHKLVLKNKKQFKKNNLIEIFKMMALIEFNLTFNINENIQLGSLISVF